MNAREKIIWDNVEKQKRNNPNFGEKNNSVSHLRIHWHNALHNTIKIRPQESAVL